MCLNPIKIINPCKFLSKEHDERYLISVKCGHCSECLRDLSNEWYYRSWYEFNDTCQNGGYVLFDTLTYRNKHLPHLSDFMDVERGSKMDFPCFNHEHFRLFFVWLRRYLTKKGYDVNGKLTYLLTSEYGSDDRYSHRPHYHILFYVKNSSLPSLVLSSAISKCWRFGRTDGVAYHGRQYVLSKRVYRNSDTQNVQFVCKYVSKYLQKSSKFQKEIDKRVTYVFYKHAESLPDGWIFSEEGKKYKRDLLRQVNQFHRQSQHFGESALSDMDILSLMNNGGFLTMPDYEKVVLRIPLPTYYKRKIFYELVSYGSGRRSRSWQLNELGKSFASKREKLSIEYFTRKLRELAQRACPSSYPVSLLASTAEYVCLRQGRLRGRHEIVNLTDKQNLPLHYNYVTSSDKINFGRRFVSDCYLGVNDEYFGTIVPYSAYFLRDFVAENTQYESEFENILSSLYHPLLEHNQRKQDLFDYQQELRNKLKHLSVL